MKKIIALVLTLIMVLAFAACGENTPQNETPTPTAEAPAPTEEAKAPETVGEKLYADFKANHSGTALEIAQRLIGNEIIQFMGDAMAVEEGFLSGFDNYEVKGFKEGAVFLPMIGTIPFVGYIFILEDGADVEAFKTNLKDNANLRWNICVQAEELVVENEGNIVFFLMCPKTFETPEMPEGEGEVGGMDMGVEGEIPAFDGEVPAADGEVPAFDGEVA